MAVCHVDSTKHLNSAVNYTYKGKPHHDDAYVQGKRALMIDSVNASSNPKDFKFETSTFLKSNPMTRKGTATGIRTIISFGGDDLDYRKYGDRKKALAIGKWFAEHKYPHNQSLIVLQADNKNHWLHDHIITCARRLDNGLSSNSGATFKNTVKFTNMAEEQYGIKPLESNIYNPKRNTSIVTNKIAEKNKHVPKSKQNNPKYHTYSFINDLHNRIVNSYKNATSFKQFTNNLNDQYILYAPVEKLKTNKETGQRQYHFYNHPTNKGHYVKITPKLIQDKYNYKPVLAKNSHLKDHQGQYLRFKKHITYIYNDKLGKNRIIRAKKLGTDTDIDTILTTINKNQRSISITHTPHHPDNPSQAKHKYGSIKDLGITKGKRTFTKYLPSESSINIHGVHKPIMTKPRIDEPVMKFQPKSHELSKAVNDLTRALNKIKDATQDGSNKQREYLEQAYEDSLLRKKQAEKVNEINNKNRQIYAKVSQDNYDNKIAYYRQQAAYNWELKRAERHQEFQR